MIVIKGADLFGKTVDIAVDGDRVAEVGDVKAPKGATVVDARGLTALPAFVDMHVHLREPGFEYKEDIESGCRAAVAGGFAAVCCMPNTKPVTDNKYIVKYVKTRAEEVGLAKVYPIAAITVGQEGKQIAELGKLKAAGAVAFSDDGRPVENAQTMRVALEYAKQFDALLISHCEELSLVAGGVINEGYIASEAGYRGITRASEEVMVAREIVLADALSTKVHIAHISTEGSARLIRDAKRAGIRVSCETCPHYFAATDELAANGDPMAKVNPPLREERDREAIVRAIQDGTVDAIVTDHAPHAAHEKGALNDAANGISGLETSFALSYTYLVKSGAITLQKLSQLMTENPARLVDVPCGRIEKGGLADIVLVDLGEQFEIEPERFFSKGKNTPFKGRKVFGRVKMTMVEGKIKFKDGEIC